MKSNLELHNTLMELHMCDYVIQKNLLIKCNYKMQLQNVITECIKYL